MSTKATIYAGDKFHFYNECYDDDNVYLELEDVEYFAERNSVTIAIPNELWQVLREYESVGDLKFAEYTDEQIQQHVVTHLRTIKLSEEATHLSCFMFMYGDIANTTEEEQIKKGIEYFSNLREKQKNIKAKINEIKTQTKKWLN